MGTVKALVKIVNFPTADGQYICSQFLAGVLRLNVKEAENFKLYSYTVSLPLSANCDHLRGRATWLGFQVSTGLAPLPAVDIFEANHRSFRPTATMPRVWILLGVDFVKIFADTNMNSAHVKFGEN